MRNVYRRSFSKLSFAAGMYVLLTACSVPSVAAAGDEGVNSVKGILMERHFSGDMARLESAAGGREALVSSLIALRHADDVPFVAVRAERLLLNFADRSDVEAALREDLTNSSMKGLARTVVLHLDAVPDDSTRQGLARLAVERSRSEKDFLPYIKAMQSSADPVVRSIAGGAK